MGCVDDSPLMLGLFITVFHLKQIWAYNNLHPFLIPSPMTLSVYMSVTGSDISLFVFKTTNIWADLKICPEFLTKYNSVPTNVNHLWAVITNNSSLVWVKVREAASREHSENCEIGRA